MMRSLRKKLKQYRRDESGAAPVIEFVIMFPMLIFVLLSAFEMGLFAFRQNWLDRGMDLAVRDIRLNTGQNYTHTQVKSMICSHAGFLRDCNAHLKLEMNPVDPRGFLAFAGGADCVDTSKPLEPSRSFVHGTDHTLMIMRACYLYKPVFPHIGIGERMANAGEPGYFPMVAVSVFVQEPRS